MSFMKAKFESIIKSKAPVFVDFFTEWCEPCKIQSPLFQELVEYLGEMIKIIKIDIDKNPEITQRYGIQALPTFMLFKNGEIKFKQVGMTSRPQLLELVMQNA